MIGVRGVPELKIWNALIEFVGNVEGRLSSPIGHIQIRSRINEEAKRVQVTHLEVGEDRCLSRRVFPGK